MTAQGLVVALIKVGIQPGPVGVDELPGLLFEFRGGLGEQPGELVGQGDFIESLADQAMGFVFVGGEVERGHDHGGQLEGGQEVGLILGFGPALADGLGAGVADPLGLGGAERPAEQALEGGQTVGEVEDDGKLEVGPGATDAEGDGVQMQGDRQGAFPVFTVALGLVHFKKVPSVNN